MTKIRYWSKVLLELDTDTQRIRIIQGFAQAAAGTGTKKKDNKIKPIVSKQSEEELR